MSSRILPVFFILIAAGLLFGYVRPTYAGPVSALQARISQYDTALAAADRYDQREAQLASDRDKLPADALARLNSFLPDGVDNVRLILDLTALASRSGIALSGFTVGSGGKAATASVSSASAPTQAAVMPGATGGVVAPTAVASVGSSGLLNSVDLSVTATGTYGAFSSFLTGLETSLRPMDLVNLEVKGSSTGVYTYAMTLRIYWLR